MIKQIPDFSGNYMKIFIYSNSNYFFGLFKNKKRKFSNEIFISQKINIPE